MKIHTILTALAVLAAALAHPAQAEFTRHGGQAHTKGEVTHLNGIALPPITTAAQARAESEKRLAVIKTTEAKAAADSAALDTRHSSLATGPQDIFYTGKPYLEETGQYVFLFRHYDPELGRWTTSDPSGFPDGANNVAYMAVPTTEFDWQGLKSVAWVAAWTSLVSSEIMNTSYNQFQSSFQLVRQGFIDEDEATRGTQNATHLLDDGDSFDFFSVGDAFDFASPSISSYDRIYLAIHGNSETGNFYLGDQAYPRNVVQGFSNNIYMLEGCGNGFITTSEVVTRFFPTTRSYLLE
jgi:RHS repeat-associated protein